MPFYTFVILRVETQTSSCSNETKGDVRLMTR